MKTEILRIHADFPELDKIAHCARIIRQGGLVIFPTETVYGIAADGNNPRALARLREIKQRPEGKPFSIHIARKDLLANYSSLTDTRLYKLIDACWPGPLTVIVPSREAGQTVGIRMPQNMIALHLIQESRCSVVAPSANISGQPAPVTCEEALRALDGLVDAAIDGGPARFGQSSSVVDFTVDAPRVIRSGVLTQEDVDHIVGQKLILFVCTGNSCRSVMAEYLLRDMVQDRPEIEVESAGTGVFLHAAASSETLRVLRQEGLDASAHQSQPVTNVLLQKSDLILVMTAVHRQQIVDRLPSVANRVYLLREFTGEPVSVAASLDIPDPMGRPAQAYEESLLMIKEAVAKLVKLI